MTKKICTICGAKVDTKHIRKPTDRLPWVKTKVMNVPPNLDGFLKQLMGRKGIQVNVN